MLKENKPLVIALIIAIGAAAGFAASNYLPFKPGVGASYSAVYLTSGDVYVGELSFLPKMSLSNVYLLQTVRDPKDPTKSSFQLSPLKDSLWSPHKIYLNPNQVIFYGPVGEDSNVAKALRTAKP